MKVYDYIIAVLSLMGFIILGWVVSFGTSDFHQNPAELEFKLSDAANSALAEAGHDWAGIEFDGQSARLFGSPPSSDAAAEAEALVRKADGGGGIIFGGVTKLGVSFEDIIDIPTIDPYVWRVVKSPAGDLRFVGHVPNEKIRAALLQRAGELSPGEVIDRLELGLGDVATDWSDKALFALGQTSLIDSGAVRLRDNHLHIGGVATDDTNRIRVIAEVSNLTEPWAGTTRLRGPSLWSANHSDDQLVLSGQVESAALKQEIFGIAAQYFDGEVVDSMMVGSSEHEDWVDGVRAGLPHFTQFESGEMAFEPTGLGYVFEGEASSSTLQYLKEDMAQVETDFPVDVEVETVAVELEELSGVELSDDPVQACQQSFNLIMASNKVYFATGNAVITRESGETLDKILAVSGRCETRLIFEIGGHTDNTGDPGANMVLSEDRARAVANYMQQAGFETDRLLVQGYGADQPTRDNTTVDGRAANRRIEFRVRERSE